MGQVQRRTKSHLDGCRPEGFQPQLHLLGIRSGKVPLTVAQNIYTLWAWKYSCINMFKCIVYNHILYLDTHTYIHAHTSSLNLMWFFGFQSPIVLVSETLTKDLKMGWPLKSKSQCILDPQMCYDRSLSCKESPLLHPHVCFILQLGTCKSCNQKVEASMVKQNSVSDLNRPTNRSEIHGFDPFWAWSSDSSTLSTAYCCWRWTLFWTSRLVLGYTAINIP